MKPHMMVIGLGLLLVLAQAASAEPGDGREACAAQPPVRQGPIVNGRQRQPTQAEFEARMRELRAASRLGLSPCAAPDRKGEAPPAIGEAGRPADGP